MRPSLALLAGCVPHLYSEGGDSGPKEWAPVENTWKQCGTPSPSFYDEPTGYDVGERFPDARMADQNGDVVSIWQFTGCVTVVDMSTGWCGPCQQLARDVDELYADYQPRDVMYTTLLSEDANYGNIDHQDLIDWSKKFGVTTTPILEDHAYTSELFNGGQMAFPRVLILDAEMRVVNANVGQTDLLIRDALDSIL
jgi:thiol-disulfide isomerase/thioredoxin